MPHSLMQQSIAAGRRYADLLTRIDRSQMTRAWRDEIDAINKAINAAVDNVFGFDAVDDEPPASSSSDR